MKIIVTGCKGQLGTEIIKQLREGRSEIGPIPEKLQSATVIPVDLPELDISNYKMVDDFIRRQRPDVIINCTGITDTDECEANPEHAYRVNALGARNLSIVARKCGSKIVQLSTDDVFDGKSDQPYNEFDQTRPQTAYGKSKLAGEQYVYDFTYKHFFIRCTWV